MPTATLHANPAAPLHFFHAEFFLNGRFYDARPRLFVARTLNEARLAAAWFSPKGTEQIVVELRPEQFEELCRRYEHVDPNRFWIVGVDSPSELAVYSSGSDERLVRRLAIGATVGGPGVHL